MNKKMKAYIVGAILGLLGGVILYYVQPVQWKVEALVKVGQISQNQNQNQNQNQLGVESMPTVLERLKSKSFAQASAKRSNNKDVENILDAEIGSGINVKTFKLSESLIISLVGKSSELVKASIDSVVAELIIRHDAIIDEYKVDISKEISILDIEVADMKKHLTEITETKAVDEKSTSVGFQVMLIEQDIDFKLTRISKLRDSISHSNIKPTILLEQPSVYEQRLFSKLWRACLFGALVGIFITLFWIRWLR